MQKIPSLAGACFYCSSHLCTWVVLKWISNSHYVLLQTGVPPDDSSLCDFQAWLLSFMGMLNV